MEQLLNRSWRSCAAGLAVLTVALAAQAGPHRPFKASAEVAHNVNRLTRCPGLEGQPGPGATFSGTGHATHLGAVQLHADHCIEIDRNQPDKPIYLFDGRMRMLAASSDELQAGYAGTFTRIAEGVYTLEGHYYVTGGTGRFANAGGSGTLFGTLQGNFNTQTQAVSLNAEGRINY